LGQGLVGLQFDVEISMQVHGVVQMNFECKRMKLFEWKKGGFKTIANLAKTCERANEFVVGYFWHEGFGGFYSCHMHHGPFGYVMDVKI
jgi:hypothetical protein